jgi:DNA-binding transcriptional regulator YdaS (Cro superfamily)
MIYIEKLFERFSTQTGIAKAVGVSQATVSYWTNGSEKPTAKNAIKIEKVTGISRAEIRADIFGNA